MNGIQRLLAAVHPAAVRLPDRRRLAFARRRDRVAQFAAVDAGRPARQGRARRLLDLYLHQLAAHTPLRPRVGREIQGSRSGGDRRAHAGVLVRARPRQRAPGGAGHAGRVSDRDRQRLCDLAAPSTTIIGRRSTSPMRRAVFGIITSARAHTRCRKWSSSNCWPRPECGDGGQELVAVDARGAEAAADWDSLKSPETYVGYEQTENFASPGGAVLDRRHVYAAPRAGAQSVGPVG